MIFGTEWPALKRPTANIEGMTLWQESQHAGKTLPNWRLEPQIQDAKEACWCLWELV